MHGIFFTSHSHAALTPRRVSDTRGRESWAQQSVSAGRERWCWCGAGFTGVFFFEIDTGWRAARAGRGPRWIGRRRELAERVRGTIAVALKLAVGPRVVGRGRGPAAAATGWGLVTWWLTGGDWIATQIKGTMPPREQVGGGRSVAAPRPVYRRVYFELFFVYSLSFLFKKNLRFPWDNWP